VAYRDGMAVHRYAEAKPRRSWTFRRGKRRMEAQPLNSSLSAGVTFAEVEPRMAECRPAVSRSWGYQVPATRSLPPLMRCASEAAMKASRSPSRTAPVLLVSTSVRRSLTIW